MRRSVIRLVIFLGVIAIIGIIAIQVYFIQISFNNEERKLNQKIQVALWDVVEQIYDLNEIRYVGKNPVYQYSPDYFVVNVNDFIDTDVLEHFLIKTFEKQNIRLDFEYAIYDCQNDEMQYGRYVNLSDKKNKPSKIGLPKHDEFVYYFGVYFPWRKQYILGNINSVYYLSGILIFVILFLAYALIVILQQRRFSELQKDVVNNLTHEFKTPLSSIILSSEVLDEDEIVTEPKRIKKYAHIIKEQANSLLTHIEKVLGMSEIEQVGKLAKEYVNLHNYIKNLVESISSRNQNKDAIFKYNLKAERFQVCADKFHLTNLLFNIIDNALKYCVEKPEIEISTYSNHKNIVLLIEDNGVGIDKKYQKKIFKKFFRIPTGDVHNVKGFGLGLSYVNDIIKQHKWNLKVESELNSGSQFIITMPLNDKDCER